MAAHIGKEKLKAITDYNGEEKKSDKQKLQIGQKIKPVGEKQPTSRVRDGVRTTEGALFTDEEEIFYPKAESRMRMHRDIKNNSPDTQEIKGDLTQQSFFLSWRQANTS